MSGWRTGKTNKKENNGFRGETLKKKKKCSQADDKGKVAVKHKQTEIDK